MRYLILLLFAAITVSCTNNGAPENNGNDSGETIHNNATDTIITNNKPVILAGCYQMTMKMDTATLSIDLQDSTITGNLDYHFKEKDRNTGTLKGVIRDQYIYADYTFQSEGTTSIREVVFKIDGDTLIPGFGDITEQGNKLVFTDRNNLQFQHETPFLKVMCSQ